MVNDNPYSCRLVVSKKVKSYINNECKQKMLDDFPELEGSKVTENQIIIDLIKNRLELFFLNDGNKSKQ